MTKENIKNFVNSLEKGNNDQATADIKNALADKVTGALDNQKVDVARSMFTSAVGVKAPEANVFTGNDIPDTSAGDVSSNEIPQ